MSWLNKIRKVVPYVPGEQPKQTDVIKLNTNENPYPPSPAVKAALEAAETDHFRLYPDPAASGLVKAVAEVYGLDEKEVFVGVGSDDVLAMCFLTFFNSKKPVLFPDITYSFYDVWANLFKIPYNAVPLDEEFHIRPEDYAGDNGGVIFANPNAPTGSFMPVSEIEKIVEANKNCIVIVDEAYIDFGGRSALPLIKKYDNVVVVQTFSKSRSMAGIRIGFAMANEKLIAYLNDVKYSFNSYTMNRTTIEIGAACVRDVEYFAETCGKIIASRERAAERLRGIGFKMQDSASNFLFVSHPEVPAKELFEFLKTKKIYVRWFDKPRIDNYLRITVGTDEQMDVLADTLSEYLQERKAVAEE